MNGKSLGSHNAVTQERVWQDFRALVEKYHESGELGGQFTADRLPGAHLRHPPFVWDGVAYRPGTLLAVGKKGRMTVRHRLRTAGPARRIVLESYKNFLAADLTDVVFVKASVVDSAWTVVSSAQNWIKFSATGPGRLLGGATAIDAITEISAINVQSTGEVGEIVVKTASSSLESASLRMDAKK